LLLLALVSPPRLTMASSTQHLSFDHAVTSQKVVALTFDADMTPRMSNELKTGKIASWYNQRVIATLREEHVPATLFLAGLWIERYPAVTQDLSRDPLFEIGNPSYSHPGFRSPCYGLGSVQKSNQAAEVQRTDALLKKIATPATWKGSQHKTIPSSVAMFTAVTALRRAQLESFPTY
jgi:peptidoglycan/xylan/chitin deacetylase (PgdA/CDA1 family)